MTSTCEKCGGTHGGHYQTCSMYGLVSKGHDPVNHPKHYTSHPSGIECIQVTRHMGFNVGNAIKYLWRADLKNGIEDLEKAVWYLKDEIRKRNEARQDNNNSSGRPNPLE